MPTFAFAGRTRAGESVSGERVADSIDALTATLRREQIQVTRVNPVREKDGAKAKKAPAKGKKVAAKNLAVFTRQFSVMIDAGLPLVQCLDILGNQEEDKNFAAVILATRSDVEAGGPPPPPPRESPPTPYPLVSPTKPAPRGGGGFFP